MKTLSRLFAGIALAACSVVAMAQDEAAPVTVSFSDPSRAGVLHARLVAGSIIVKAGTGKDVVIRTRQRGGDDTRRRERERAQGRDEEAERSAGLRRIQQQPFIRVEEQNNRMEISTPQVGRPFELEIEVPAKTSLELQTVNNGDISVTGVEGDHEIGNVNGSILLNDVKGSVVAHTTNGKVIATITRITPQKPMAFTSLNGAVDVTLPAATKGNLKLRSDNGSVYTNFDLQMLPQASPSIVEDTRNSGGRYKIEVNRMIHGAVNGGGPDIEMRTFNGDVYVRKGG